MPPRPELRVAPAYPAGAVHGNMAVWEECLARLGGCVGWYPRHPPGRGAYGQQGRALCARCLSPASPRTPRLKVIPEDCVLLAQLKSGGARPECGKAGGRWEDGRWEGVRARESKAEEGGVGKGEG